jgi:hypothetical protein
LKKLNKKFFRNYFSHLTTEIFTSRYLFLKYITLSIFIYLFVSINNFELLVQSIEKMLIKIPVLNPFSSYVLLIFIIGLSTFLLLIIFEIKDIYLEIVFYFLLFFTVNYIFNVNNLPRLNILIASVLVIIFLLIENMFSKKRLTYFFNIFLFIFVSILFYTNFKTDTEDETSLSASSNSNLIEVKNNLPIKNNILTEELFDLSPNVNWIQNVNYDAFQIDIYQLCCKQIAFNNINYKPGGYLGIYDGYPIFVNNRADILFLDKNFSNTEFNKINRIKSNINDVVNNISVFENDKEYNEFSKEGEGVRDILIYQDEIFLSYSEEIQTDCINIQILKASFNFEYISFEEFFTYEECIFRKDGSSSDMGGRLEIKNNELFFTLGYGSDYSTSQDLNSMFGKIHRIDLKSGKSQIVSLGHRNPQGLASVTGTDFLISTEHGPVSGDEINLIDLNKGIDENNYGWPYSTYGEHYNNIPEELEIKLNQKNHSNYGYTEPIYYFQLPETYKHGISEIEEMSNLPNHFLFGAMKGYKIYILELNNNFSSVVSINSYSVPHRVRDIVYDFNSNNYFILFDEGPYLGVLKLNE